MAGLASPFRMSRKRRRNPPDLSNRGSRGKGLGQAPHSSCSALDIASESAGDRVAPRSRVRGCVGLDCSSLKPAAASERRM